MVVEKGSLHIVLRPMGPEHMDCVEEIEIDQFDHPWTRDELGEARGEERNIALVALIVLPEGGEEVGGFAFVEEDKFRFTVCSIAVARKWKRQGIGRELLGYFISRLRGVGCHEIYELVRETNLDAQKFYKAIGFVACKPETGAYDTDEAAYPMIFKWEWSPQGILIRGEPERCVERDRLCICCDECDAD